MPAMTVEQIVTNILINHVDEHVRSIRTAVGGWRRLCRVERPAGVPSAGPSLIHRSPHQGFRASGTASPLRLASTEHSRWHQGARRSDRRRVRGRQSWPGREALCRSRV